MKRLLFTLMALAMVITTSCSDDDDSSGDGFYYGSVTATLPSGADYIAGGAEGDILKGKRFSEGGYNWTFSNDGTVKRLDNQLSEDKDGNITSPLMDGGEYGCEYRYTLSSDETKIYLQVTRTLCTFRDFDEECDDEENGGSASHALRWYTFSEVIARGWWSGEEEASWGFYNQIRPYELTVTKTDDEITTLVLKGICEEGFSLVDGHFSGEFSSGYGSDDQVWIRCGEVSIGKYETWGVGPFDDSVFTVMRWDEDSEGYLTHIGPPISVPYTTSGSSKDGDAKVSFTFEGKDYEATYSSENITLTKASE